MMTAAVSQRTGQIAHWLESRNEWFSKFCGEEVKNCAMIVINYHVPIAGTLKDAITTAFDIYLSSGIKPDAIDYDAMALNFDVKDALYVRMGDLSPAEYLARHVVKPVLSDAEESD